MKRKNWFIGAIILILVIAGGSIAAQSGCGSQPAEDNEDNSQEVLTGEGLIIGRIDSHSVEIEVDGEAKTFGLDDELIEQEFVDGSQAKFEYYIDHNDRAIIKKLEAVEQDNENVMTAAGVFVGLADSHTVEIKVEGEAKAFALGEGITTANLQMGDDITFSYQEDQHGRLVITRLEKKGNHGGDNGKNEELRSAEGILTGRIDNHSVEIKVDGKHQAFGLSEELMEKEFAVGEISFTYYVDKNGRSIITEADFQKPREGEVKTAEGIFSGLADSHTVEIIINGEPRSFGLEDTISFAGMEEGQEVFIAYQENAAGRLVIIKIEIIH